MTLAPNGGQPTGSIPEGAGAPTGTDEGQIPESIDELKKYVTELRKESRKHRLEARDAKAKIEAEEAARTAAAAEEAKKRGDWEKLHASEKAERERLAAELEDERFARVFEKSLSKLKPKAETLEDIHKVFDRSGLKLKDGKIEGLDEKLAEFRKLKPWYFEPEAPASGLRGYPGSNGTAAASSIPITEAIRTEAASRGLTPEAWAKVLASRQTTGKASARS